MQRPDLMLFAKHPRAGDVKTRLLPDCSAEQAAQIASRLIETTVELATSYWPGDVYLYGSPDATHDLFLQLKRDRRVHLRPQASGDLGAKMAAALVEGIARSHSAAVMGCDVPQCPGAVLAHAYARLIQGHEVIGPAHDGGFYFLGLQCFDPELFAGIDWGHAEVLQETLTRADLLDRRFEYLPELRDIDTWDDLLAVAETFPPLQKFVNP